MRRALVVCTAEDAVPYSVATEIELVNRVENCLLAEEQQEIQLHNNSLWSYELD